MLTHNYVINHFRDESFEAWLADFDDQRVAYNHPFNQHIPLIESLLSSQEGSLVKFRASEDGDTVPEFLTASNEASRVNFTNRLQLGAMQFVNDTLERLGVYLHDIEFSSSSVGHLLFSFAGNPNPVDVKMFEEMVLENMFAGSEFSVIANPHRYLDDRGNLSESAQERLVTESKWKEGARVAFAAYGRHGVIERSPAGVSNGNAKENERPCNDSERKVRKLYYTPKEFFSDSSRFYLRAFSYFFGRGFLGRLNTAILRFLMKTPRRCPCH
jgi:hypothetical protein